jgi:hypothetical protein
MKTFVKNWLEIIRNLILLSIAIFFVVRAWQISPILPLILIVLFLHIINDDKKSDD